MKKVLDDEAILNAARLSGLSPILNIILAGLIVSVLYNLVPTTELLSWSSAIIGIGILRIIQQTSFISRKTPPWLHSRLTLILTVSQSFLWGIAIVFFSDSIPPQYELFLIFIAGGIIAAAIPFLSPSLPLYLLYSISLMGPIIWIQFLKGDQFSYTMGMTCVLFLTVVIFAAIISHSNFRKLRETRTSLDNQIAFANSIYNSATDISFVTCDLTDSEYRILSLSTGSEAIFGHSKDEAVGMPLRFLFNKAAYELCRELLAKVAKGHPAKKEIDLVKKIGIVLNLSVSAYPLSNGGSEVRAALIICNDISQSRQTEKALINSEEKFRNIVESSPMGMHMYQLDPRGRLVFTGANYAADKILGIDNQKLIGVTIEQAFPNLIDSEIPGIYKKIAAEGGSWHSDQVLYKDDKIDGAFEVHAFQTSPGRMVAKFTDIAERVKTEKALRDSERRFRDITFSSSDWIWEIDASGNYTYVSEGVKEVMGYEPSELIGKSAFDIVSTDQKEMMRELFILVSSRKDNISDWINWNIHKNGSLVCIQSSGVPMIDDDGRLLGYRGVNKNITEQKRSEEQLRQSEEKYRSLIESMDEGLLIVSAQNIVIFSNKASGDIFGLPQDRIIGSHLDSISLDGDLSAKYQSALNDKNRDFRKNELTLLRRDNQKRHVLFSATLLKNQDGDILGSFGILTDITDLKKAEIEKNVLREQLTNAQRMESLGILAGGVAHDLNNILGPLVAYPDLIRMKLNDDSPVINDIKKIKRSAERAAEVVQDLLTLARRGRYELSPVNMISIIESYLNSHEFGDLRSRNPNVKISTDLEKDTPLVYGSEMHLHKVIMNLIINSMDAMPNGGNLSISLGHRHVEKLIGGFDNLVAGNYIIFSIKDNGSGIEKSDLKRIFEPFYSRKKMGRSGSGLGLSIVYGIVKDHNGYIDVVSEVGKGSEFVVYLPVVKVKPRAEEPAVIDIRGSEKILIVDDMEEQRDLASTILSSLGYNVRTASGGREAVELLKSAPADLVVLDMIMEEGFDGLDTYREIIKIYPGQKAIIASGFSETDRVKEAEKLGVGRYIRKPYNMQILGRAIREVLSGQAAVSTGT